MAANAGLAFVGDEHYHSRVEEGEAIKTRGRSIVAAVARRVREADGRTSRRAVVGARINFLGYFPFRVVVSGDILSVPYVSTLYVIRVRHALTTVHPLARVRPTADEVG